MRASRRWRYRSFYLEQSALDDVVDGLGIRELSGFRASIVHDRDLIEGFSRLHRTLDGDADTLRRRELLVATIGQLVRRYGSTRGRVAAAPRDQAVLRSVIRLTRDRYAERLTLRDLTSGTGLTQFQLIGLFRRGVGMTPHAYLTQIRLDAARSQLRRSVPIAAAAVSSGFYDQAALTRCSMPCSAAWVRKKRFGEAGTLPMQPVAT